MITAFKTLIFDCKNFFVAKQLKTQINHSLESYLVLIATYKLYLDNLIKLSDKIEKTAIKIQKAETAITEKEIEIIELLHPMRKQEKKAEKLQNLLATLDNMMKVQQMHYDKKNYEQVTIINAKIILELFKFRDILAAGNENLKNYEQFIR